MANVAPLVNYVRFFSVPIIGAEGRGIFSEKNGKQKPFSVVPIVSDSINAPTHICFCKNLRGYSVAAGKIYRKKNGCFVLCFDKNVWFNLIGTDQAEIFLMKPFFSRL